MCFPWNSSLLLKTTRAASDHYGLLQCAGDVRFAGSQVPAEIELVGADGRSEPITVGGEDSGAPMRDMLCTTHVQSCAEQGFQPKGTI